MMYLAYVEELLSDNAALTFEKHAYFIESKAHYQTLLKYKDDEKRGKKYYTRRPRLRTDSDNEG